ncbi:MAG: hypothetical protein ACI379_01970, partial [Nocardioides sp.]|uniref:hypothetical protein n=1 Tax=Nocardioides sp. TaxID=35761 RepID=UPI003EFC61CD
MRAAHDGSRVEALGVALAALLTCLAGWAPVAAATPGAPTQGARASAPALHASPARPVPGQDVRLHGRASTKGVTVALQRARGTGWTTVRTKRAGARGRYAFSVRATTSAATYRVRFARSGKASRTVRVRPVDAETLWEWDMTCRGSTGPASDRACVARDRAIKALGRVVARDFTTAWRAKDRDAMLALATDEWFIDRALTWTLTSAPADCRYDPDVPDWYCFV